MAGLTFSNVFPSAASTSLPSISMRASGLTFGVSVTVLSSVALVWPLSSCGDGNHRGRPRTRSATMLRWISEVPPAMVPAKVRR